MAATREAGVSISSLGDTLREMGRHYDGLQAALAELRRVRTATEHDADGTAGGLRDAMLAVRRECDALELLVADDLWPLPKYREMLFCGV